MRRRAWLLFLFALLAGCGGGGSASGVPSVLPTGNATNAPPATWAFSSLGPVNTSYLTVPESGKINAFGVTSANVLFIAGGAGTGLETFSEAGAYRSSDGGASWQQVYSGVVNALWLDPAQPTHVIAGDDVNGIVSSSDGGASWRRVYPTTKVTQFAQLGSALFATSIAGILVSNDRGSTWSVSLANVPATAFGSSGNVLVAGMSDGSIYAYANGAWLKKGALPFTALTGTAESSAAVHQIAVDPLTPSTIYATNNDGPWNQALFVSTDSGTTWKTVTYNGWPQAIAFSAVVPHQLYIGDDGGFNKLISDGTSNPSVSFGAYLNVIDIRDIWVNAGSPETCWIASDQGLDDVPDCVNLGKAGNDRVLSGPAGMTLARRLAVSSNGAVVGSFQDLQSFSTGNAGASWTSLPYLYEDGFVEFRPGSSNVCYAYDEVNGLSISLDGGKTFATPTAAAGNLAPSRLMTNALAFEPTNPLHMYFASAPTQFSGFTAATGMFESSDGGATFSRSPWPFAHPGAIVVDPHNRLHMLVSDMTSGTATISSTFDGGATWTASNVPSGEPYWYAIAISPVNGNNVVAANADASGNVFSLASGDGGRTFGAASTAALHARVVHGFGAAREVGGRWKNTAEGRGSGRHYFAYSPLRAIRFDQDATSGTPCAILTTSLGAYESCDFGSAWSRIDQALSVHSFWDVRWTGGYVYLASDGEGVLRSLAPTP